MTSCLAATEQLHLATNEEVELADRDQITKIKFLIPQGTKVEDILAKLELTFEEVPPDATTFNENVCCVDVALVSPVSTVNQN